MIALLQSMVRRLTGPCGRPSVLLLLVGAMWAWWFWTWPRPVVRWAIPANCLHDCALTADRGTLFVTRGSGSPWLASGGLPSFTPSEVAQSWDLATGQQRLTIPRVPAGNLNTGVSGVAPDGSWLVVHNFDRTSVIDGRTGVEQMALDRCMEFTIAPDSRTLAMTDGPRRVTLWDAATGRILPLF